jgi:RNA polymerase sigma-70 factor (ECF subfamily)
MQPTASRAAVGTFRALYEDHYGFVYATVARMGVRPDAIDDVVHDAFLVVFRRWDDLPAQRQRAWLYGIARRVSSNVRKGDRRRARKHEALRYAHAQAEDARGRLEARTVLGRFVGTLTPEDRELFVLGAIEGLTGRELAAALSAPASTLYGRLEVLRRQFRRAAGADAGDAIAQARQTRPRASAAGWVALVPHLGLSGISTAAGGALSWGLGGALATAAVAGAVAWLPADDVPASEPFPVPNALAPLEPTLAAAAAPPVLPRVEAQAAAAPVPASPVPVVSSSRSRRAKPVDALAAEAKLVQSIRERLAAGESRAALRLVDRHRRRHAQGVLADVVVALEVEALCDLGRPEEGRARAQALLQRRPNTPVARRLSSGCRGDKRSAGVGKTDERGHGGQ